MKDHLWPVFAVQLWHLSMRSEAWDRPSCCAQKRGWAQRRHARTAYHLARAPLAVDLRLHGKKLPCNTPKASPVHPTRSQVQYRHARAHAIDLLA